MKQKPTFELDGRKILNEQTDKIVQKTSRPVDRISNRDTVHYRDAELRVDEKVIDYSSDASSTHIVRAALLNVQRTCDGVSLTNKLMGNPFFFSVQLCQISPKRFSQ